MVKRNIMAYNSKFYNTYMCWFLLHFLEKIMIFYKKFKIVLFEVLKWIRFIVHVWFFHNNIIILTFQISFKKIGVFLKFHYLHNYWISYIGIRILYNERKVKDWTDPSTRWSRNKNVVFYQYFSFNYLLKSWLESLYNQFANNIAIEKWYSMSLNFL